MNILKNSEYIKNEKAKLIESVKNKLINKEFYIITSSTYDKNGNNIRTPKFIPVTITNITHGNYQYPIKVEFNFLSKRIGCVYMTIGRSIQATRNFETIFSLKDPRNSYPKISDSNWQLITNNSVTPGMNKDECRLALGIPTHIDRRRVPVLHSQHIAKHKQQAYNKIQNPVPQPVAYNGKRLSQPPLNIPKHKK